jgi:hypothetical protein
MTDNILYGYIIITVVSSFVLGILLTNAERIGSKANIITGDIMLSMDNSYKNIQNENKEYLPELNLTIDDIRALNISKMIEDYINSTKYMPLYICGYTLLNCSFGEYNKILVNQSEISCNLLFQEGLSNKILFNASKMNWYYNQTGFNNE